MNSGLKWPSFLPLSLPVSEAYLEATRINRGDNGLFLALRALAAMLPFVAFINSEWPGFLPSNVAYLVDTGNIPQSQLTFPHVRIR